MLKKLKMGRRTPCSQRGAAAVEFALVAIVFFTILFAILEFGRLFYLYNSAQEVTRRAAREAVVRWIDEMDDDAEVEALVLFGGTGWPFGGEITAENINIEYLTATEGIPSPFPDSPEANMSACLSVPSGCVALVRVSITATYTPMFGLFPFLAVTLPASTVTMPAESLGYRL